MLVRIAHAGLTVMHVKTREGDHDGSAVYRTRLPSRMGMEGGGIVDAVGDGLDALAAGDRVSCYLIWNSYAEYAVVPAAKVAEDWASALLSERSQGQGGAFFAADADRHPR